MKFLQCANLSYLNSLLDGADAGDCRISGRLEAYSCKPIKTDKRLSHRIEQRLLEEMQFARTWSPDLYPRESPEGPPALSLSLDDTPLDPSHPILSPSGFGGSSRPQTYTSLVLCLNHCYNHELDFSAVAPEDFEAVACLSTLRGTIDAVLEKFASAMLPAERLRDEFWGAVSEVVEPRGCECWTYLPTVGDDPIQATEPATLWSKHFFFYNRRLKKILLFRCWATSKLVSRGEEDATYASTEDDDDFYEPNMKNIDFHFRPRDVFADVEESAELMFE